MTINELYSLFLSCHGSITTDSRCCPQGSIFFALKGDNFNGNAFAAKALEAGCAYAVIDESAFAPAGDNRYIVVHNVLQTLQQLARHHRRTLGTRMLAITGTNGKTTTKELIAAVLSRRYPILYTQGNLNNAIGVPLTLLRLKPEHELAVIEMGASHPGDIKELVDIAEPDYGIITNVGRAHLQGFGSLEGVIQTKGELFDYLRQKENRQDAGKSPAFVFIHHENPYLQPLAAGLPTLAYGTTPGLYISGKVTGNSPFLAFEWHTAEEAERYSVSTRLIGEYNFLNALAAIAVGRFFHVPAPDICHALSEYTPQNNRSQLKRTERNTLIIDAYNANPTSMHAALSNFHHMQVEGKMLILGDMRELGNESAAEHRKIVDYLNECGFEDVRLVGEQFAAIHHSYRTYPDAPALIADLQQEMPQGKTILIKGSNGIKLSTVVDYL